MNPFLLFMVRCFDGPVTPFLFFFYASYILMCMFCVFLPCFICVCSKARVCVYVWNSSVCGHFCSLFLQPDQNQLSSITLFLLSPFSSFHSSCLFVFLVGGLGYILLFLNASESLFCLFFYWGRLLCCSPATFIPPGHSTPSAQLRSPGELEKHLTYSC